MGVTIRQREDGAWWLFISHRGQRKAKKVGDKEAAKEVARKARIALASGDLNLARAAAPLFKDYALAWLKQYPQVNGLKEATVENYEKSVRLYLLPAFGSLPLTAIDRAAVKAFVARLREAGSIRRPGAPLDQGSVKLMLAPLRLILGDAVDNGILQANPASKVGKWNKRKTEREAEGCDPFTAEELEKIAATAREQVTPLWPLVGLWAQSGMREGEAFGLQWRDLDPQAETAIVRRTLGRGRVGSPKTGRSRAVTITHRLLERPEAVLEALREIRSVREAEAAVAGRPFDTSAFVFLAPSGRPFGMDNSGSFSRLWSRCLRLAGVRHRNPEQLRHTFASTLLSRGESLLYVQEQGGWANATTLLKHYSRFLPRQASRLQPAATPAQPVA
jgi:integrase